MGGPGPYAAAAVLLWAAMERFAPGAAPIDRIVALAVAGALLCASPVRIREGRLPWRAALLGAVAVPPAVLLLRLGLRALAGGSAPGPALSVLPFALLLALLVTIDARSMARLARLVRVEAFKTRRSTLLRVGLVAAALLTLLSGLLRERLTDASGWSVMAGTIGTGFWTAQVFLLVLGATALAGEASAGTLKMMLPHAYRRGDWVAAKAVVLALAALAFTIVVAGLGAAHAAATEGLGDVVQTIEPLFPTDPVSHEVFAPAARMEAVMLTRVLLGLAALLATGMLGLFCSALFESVTASLCFAFLLFGGVEFADVFLGLSQDVMQRLYTWYPDRAGLLVEKLGRALNVAWDDALLRAGLSAAAAATGLLLLFAVRAFARRDVHA